MLFGIERARSTGELLGRVQCSQKVYTTFSFLLSAFFFLYELQTPTKTRQLMERHFQVRNSFPKFLKSRKFVFGAELAQMTSCIKLKLKFSSQRLVFMPLLF